MGHNQTFMKKVLFTFLAALTLAACKKTTTITTVPSEATYASINDSKAIVISGQHKKTDDGLELDYDLVIKEVSANTYSTSLRLGGITYHGKREKWHKSTGFKSIVIGINNTKKDDNVPLSVLLETTEVQSMEQGQVIKFNEFEYKGDLSYEVVNTSLSLIIDNPLHTGIEIQSNVLFSLLGTGITLTDSKIDVKGGSFEMKEDSRVLVNGESTVTSFGIMFKGGKEATFTSHDEYFILPSGHTVAQNPEVAKVKIEDNDGYVTVIVSGDPAKTIKSIYYTPETKGEPVMKFAATHFNQKNGIQRFVSTQKWKELYGKKPFSVADFGEGWSRVTLVK